jgi:Protein of unknown function (DUF2800)
MDTMSQELPIHPPAEAPDRPHAERSASQLKYLAVCAGYKPGKKGRTHWVTEQGIRGHTAMQNEDDGDLQSDYEEKLVQLCRDYEATLPPAIVVVRESRIETIENRWGYPDTLRFWTGSADVQAEIQNSPLDEMFLRSYCENCDYVDYKFVKKAEVEDAEVNLQGKDYAIGIFEKYPSLKRLKVHFPMPRFGSVTTHEFTREDLPRLKLEVFSILTRARKTDNARCSSKLFTPEYNVCRYCGRKATCPAIGKIAHKVAEAYLGTPIPGVPAEVHPSRTKDPATLGALKTIASILEGWCESVHHHTSSAALDEGVMPEGYTVDYQKGQRRVTNPLALLTVGPKYGLTVADVLDNAKVSIAGLEDVVMAKAPRGKKGFTKNAFLDELRDADALSRSEDRPYLKKL